MLKIFIIISLLAVLACTSDNTNEEIPKETPEVSKTAFQSKLFKKGKLVYSDDFDGEFNDLGEEVENENELSDKLSSEASLKQKKRE